jgi:4-amino-4-deoxy-L-arabinose transferase-like glycosyltransferase
MKSFEKAFPYFLVAGILINVNGLLNDILEPDGALYATISKHIALSGEWFNLYGDGHDWLDKPHFPFWMAAASFKLFGITSFAYKFPAFLFWLWGCWFVYSLTRELYDVTTAKVAVIIYIFSLHGILNNFDVRAEPYLTTLAVAAVYYFYKATIINEWKYVVLTALMAACAVMTKGIFVLLTIGGGFVIYWIVSKQWKQFINFRWYIMLFLIFLFITPELYSLYVQFDLHPEKVVFGKTNVSGLRFFFWDSQFGRFFNTGPIKGEGDKSFFLHTTLWTFLPWSILLYIATIRLIIKRSIDTDLRRWIIYGSAAVTFVLFSFSGFQLPFYIVIIFPQFSIITAAYLTSLQNTISFKRISVLQNSLLVIAALLVCALALYTKFGNVILTAIISITIIILNFLYKSKPCINRIIMSGVAFSFVLFLFLHNFFYPNLLTYQSGMMAGKYLVNTNNKKTAAMFRANSYSFEFYAPGYVPRLETFTELNSFLDKASNGVIYTTLDKLQELNKQQYSYNILANFSDFHISMLTGSFLNPYTRSDELKKAVLVRVQKKDF